MELTKKRVMKEAQDEVNAENAAKYKTEYKTKLRELGKAKLVVSNIEREISELELKMTNELG